MNGFEGLWNFVFQFPCIFHMLTGYYCPGCGGTRALKALLHGQILQSLYYHPIVPYLAGLGIWWLMSTVRHAVWKKKMGFSLKNWMIVVGIFLVFVNWIGKNLVLCIWKIPLL